MVSSALLCVASAPQPWARTPGYTLAAFSTPRVSCRQGKAKSAFASSPRASVSERVASRAQLKLLQKCQLQQLLLLFCTLLLLTKSLSFSCHKYELIWLSFRKKKVSSLTVISHYYQKIWLGGFSEPLFVGFCFISWRSTDKALS